MNIYILNWRDILNPLAGGAEISLFEQVKYWRKKGANIYWFASSFSNQTSSEQEHEGINIIRRGSHFTVHIFAFLFFSKIKLNPEDIIVDSFHFLPFFTPLYIKKNKIIALINETARELWFKNLIFPFSLLGYLLEPSFFLFYKKTQFMTGSDSAKRDVIKFGIPAENISIVSHGFNPPSKHTVLKKEKNPTVLFLSRITVDKGIEDAIAAVSILKESIPNLKFWIAGKAETKKYEDHIKQMVKEKKIEKITSFLGYVSEDKKYELYKRAWVLVHPSVKEGWGLNVIEANSCGTVAVAYSVPGLTDSIVDNKTGILAGSISTNNLAKGLEVVLKNPKKREDLEREAKIWSKNFSWDMSGRNSWSLIQKNKNLS